MSTFTAKSTDPIDFSPHRRKNPDFAEAPPDIVSLLQKASASQPKRLSSPANSLDEGAHSGDETLSLAFLQSSSSSGSITSPLIWSLILKSHDRTLLSTAEARTKWRRQPFCTNLFQRNLTQHRRKPPPTAEPTVVVSDPEAISRDSTTVGHGGVPRKVSVTAYVEEFRSLGHRMRNKDRLGDLKSGIWRMPSARSGLAEVDDAEEEISKELEAIPVATVIMTEEGDTLEVGPPMIPLDLQIHHAMM